MGDLESLLLGEIIKRKLINDLAQGLAAAAIAADEKDNDNKLYGLRVVRGPDWTRGEQDGGNGYVGTVVHPPPNLDTEDKHVVVQWDMGIKALYKARRDVGLDLRVFDTAQLGVRHANITCDGCKEQHIWSYRWKCIVCRDFDLCTRCYMTNKHDTSHEFFRMDFNRSTGFKMPPRKTSSQVMAKGLFPGAKVKRGPDWQWHDQDGLGIGIATKFDNWKDGTYRDGLSVAWLGNPKENSYRVGYDGRVDLSVVEPATYFPYYPEHLPVLNLAEDRPLPIGQHVIPPSIRDNTTAAFIEYKENFIGSRVMRKQDWPWNDGVQEYVLGTVEGEQKPGLVRVFWDDGKRGVYRSGFEGQHDLLLVDNAPAGCLFNGITCSTCGKAPLRGIQWKCADCKTDVQICTQCYGKAQHSIDHSFLRIDRPNATSVRMFPRQQSERHHVCGLFKGATVVRGPDWDKKDTDGGPGRRGKVTKLFTEKERMLGQGMVEVQWDNGATCNCRAGLGGFIDVMTVENGEGYFVFREHLPEFVTTVTGVASVKPKIQEQVAPQMKAQPEVKNYNEIAEIGKGAFGKVWRCFDPDLGRDFALKRVDIDVAKANEQQVMESFEKEIAFYKTLKHRRIVQYYGCRRDGKILEIFLEYLPGGDLRSIVPVKEPLAKRFTKQILEGLEYLHRNKIRHLDIKCANILRDTEGNVRLADFGVSDRMTTLTSGTAANIGPKTLLYTPPEIMRGGKSGTRADIWSLGCTFIEMLCGTPPNWDCSNLGEAVARITQGRMIYSLPSGVTSDAKNFAEFLLIVDPDKRPTALEAMHHDYLANVDVE